MIMCKYIGILFGHDDNVQINASACAVLFAVCQWIDVFIDINGPNTVRHPVAATEANGDRAKKMPKQ